MPITLTETVPTLRVPQARVLNALLPANPSYPTSEWPLLTRKMLNVAVGYSPISTGVTRPLYGVSEGSSTAHPHKGLLALGLVEVVQVDVQGAVEDNYRITKLGIVALGKFLVEGGKLLPTRDRGKGVIDTSSYTNKRYKEQATSP